MKEKFEFIYNTVKSNMEKLDKKLINVEQAKAMASLAKQANNVLTTQSSSPHRTSYTKT